MPILTAIYRLVIGPLQLFFEVLFGLAYKNTYNPGISILFLSLGMRNTRKKETKPNARYR